MIKINDEKQTIQDVYISDKELYQQVRFVVENEHLAGWNPTKEDVEELVESAFYPDIELDNKIDELFGE